MVLITATIATATIVATAVAIVSVTTVEIISILSGVFVASFCKKRIVNVLYCKL